MSTFVGSTTGVPQTGLVYVDGLLWGSRWRIENDNRRLTYSFVNDQTWDDNFYSAEETAFHNAMQSWANVANFRLEFSGYNDHNAEITFHSVQGNVIPGASGMAMPPGTNYIPPFVEGDVMINWETYQANPNAELIVGSHDYSTYVHEIGHALGLAHPHDNGGTSSIYPGVDNAQDPGNYGLNQFVWTVMSYVGTNSPYSPGYDTNWGFIRGPMAFDIAAIQYLYGANTTYNTGNNTYYLPTTNGAGTYWSCIWDAGGIDTISGQGATNSVTINLNNASLANNDPNAGGYINRMNGIRGGFTIANSHGGLCVVENAIGGAGHDTLIGNAVANSLSAGGGNDYLYGNAGNDYLSGGSGNDYFNGGAGNDAMYGGIGHDTLLGSSGNDRLVGYASGTEYDILTGGTGTDVFVLGQSSGAFYQGNGYATITDFNWVYDYFQVKGVASQYSLQFANWIGGASQDTAIYYGNDAIGLVQDTTNVNFARDFIFV